MCFVLQMCSRRGRLACLWDVTQPWLELDTVPSQKALEELCPQDCCVPFPPGLSPRTFYFPCVPSRKGAERNRQPKVIPMPAPELQRLHVAAQAGTQGKAGRSQDADGAVTSLVKQTERIVLWFCASSQPLMAQLSKAPQSPAERKKPLRPLRPQPVTVTTLSPEHRVPRPGSPWMPPGVWAPPPPWPAPSKV